VTSGAGARVGPALADPAVHRVDEVRGAALDRELAALRACSDFVSALPDARVLPTTLFFQTEPSWNVSTSPSAGSSAFPVSVS
jgi:hypothetical protein